MVFDMACMKCEERIIETNTAVIKCFLCDKMLHHRCIHDAGILATRWSSKSKPPAIVYWKYWDLDSSLSDARLVLLI